MIIIKQTIFINAPPTKVWGIFSNLDNWPKLNPFYKYAKHISGKPWAVNSKFEFFSEYGFIKTKSVTKVLKSNPPNEVTWIGTKPLIRGRHTFNFKKSGEGTLVTNYEEFTGLGLPIIFFLNLKPKIEKSFDCFMKGLKKECEN